MSKGFTLSELLGVIVILSILSLIAIIAVDSQLKSSKYSTCKVQNNTIIEGAKSLLIDYPDVLPSGSEVLDIPYAVLVNGGAVSIENGSNLKSVTVSGGYLEELINPMTDKVYDDSVAVKVTASGKGYNYELIFQNEEDKCKK